MKSKLKFGRVIVTSDVPCSDSNNKLYGWSSCWNTMFKRCYSKNHHKSRPTYAGCEVCPDWHNVNIFREFYLSNYFDGAELDKDLLFFGNKIYSPQTSVFVPSWINSMLTSSKSSRGDLPIGVSFNRNHKKFNSRCSINGTNKNLGFFDSVESAHIAWRLCKADVIEKAIERLILEYPSINRLPEICNSLRIRVDLLRNLTESYDE